MGVGAQSFTVDTPAEYCVAYQGDKGKLRVATFNSHQEWSDHGDQQSVGITGSPAMVTYKGRNFCLHQGQSPGDSGTLWCGEFTYSPSDASFHFTDTKVAGAAISGSPAVAVFKDLLYCFYQGCSGGKADASLRCQTYDGRTWSEVSTLFKGAVIENPAAATYKDSLYCAFGGKGAVLIYTAFNGKDWSEPEAARVYLSCSPSLVEYDSKLYCLHQDDNLIEGNLEWNVFDGQGWQWDSMVKSVGMAGSPAGTVIPATNGRSARICCVHRGETGNDLWHTYFDGTTWTRDLIQPVGDAEDSPAVLRVA
ncbi:hypothetical protein [Streptomyces sp. NPDC058595]|uniref:hypothetical protein n=1 Tax=Streptomyces sp. NPDC058595 TaxID=3346550 RepID=UPI0036520CB7